MTLTSDILEGLNPEQKEAVESIDGPLLIIAGPGSGKTRVITHRIAHLVRDYGVSPYRILSMTFTNKAAREMRDRLERLVGPRSESLTVGTFHSFCARLLRREGEPVGLSSSFSIYDGDDQLSLIKQSLQLANLDPKQNPPQAIRSVISRAKSVMMDSRGLSQHGQSYFEEVSARVYHHYEELLSRNNAVDFDDLLMKSVQLLQEQPEVRERYQQRYQYLMVDEFQDTNVTQYRLASLLTGAEQNICVVGDPDQSIYSWRSADIRNILSFQSDYPQAKTINLEQNYRSTSNILEASQKLISVNGIRLEKGLFTENGKGEPVVVHEAYDEQEEAGFAIGEIERLVRQERIKAGDCAVMYRVNAQSRALEEACLHRGMQYRLVGGVRFYQRREVKDLMAYLNLLQNPLDEVNLTRVIGVPPRGIGAKSMQDLARWAREQNVSLISAMQQIAAARSQGQPSPVPITARASNAIADFADMVEGLVQRVTQVPIVDLIDQVLDDTGLRRFIQNSDDRPDERWENILEFRETAQEFNAEDPGDGLASLLEKVSLVADVDNYEDSEESLTLITLHQAKGLEFPVVFIVGLEEGLLPHSRSMDSEEQLEEERRLCYVGITRAQRRLYLLRAFRRGFMGNSGPTLSSRFLREIPAELVAPAKQDQTRARTSTPLARTPLANAPAAAPVPVREVPSIGDLVRHSTFGEGVVMECLAASGDHEVTVHFKGEVGIKRLLLSFAPLEKIDG
ncbi:MAG: AAA family ATPase [Planctomyces sp.]|nr:AAA family ATPase [Planctomyces sp.]